ncbi:iron ABC transporter permease [Oceanicola sp. 502str15]|uniref:ABC transporter permease n=1 Tax=Oceanicola sp. 502str15 TaxID=2696061 RepID=UPI0020955250|nr:iron ABC transporter permease [Oceanicola sp. 502str15]MCO6381743.1 ABC transporter permease subunit [Oceanicola sp. 502str15]
MTGAASTAAPRRRWHGGFTLFAGLLSLTIAAMILYPLINVFLTTFFPGGRFAVEAFQAVAESGLGSLLANTLLAVGTASVLAVFIGSLFAWLTERGDLGLNTLGAALPVLPLMVPPIAGAIGWVLLAAPRSGFVNAWTAALLERFGMTMEVPIIDIFSMKGLIFVYVIYLVPHVFLTVTAALRNLDPSLEEAARVSGAGAFATLRTVTLPAVLPQVIAGGILALITGLALFSVPLVVGGQAGIEVLSVRIVHLMTVSYPPRTGEALILGMVILAAIGLCWWVQRRVLARGAFATIAGKGQRVARVRLGVLRWPARIMVGLYVLIASVLPVGALILVSLQAFWTPKVIWARLDLDNYRDLFDSSFVTDGLRNSLALGIAGATVGMFIAAVIVYWVDRNRGRRRAALVDGVTKLPAALSHLVIGIAFIAAYAGAPFYLHGTLAILFMAYIVLYTPQSTFTSNAALVQVGPSLIEASLVAGAGLGRSFFNVTLPLMTPGLMAGWTMLFVLIAGDITASSMLAGSRNPVAGFVILDLWTNGSFPPLAAFATVVTFSMMAIVLLSIVLTRRSR